MIDDLQAACAAAIAGAGVARIPSFVTVEPLARGALIRRFPDHTSTVRDLWVVYPSRSFVPAKIRSFVEVLVDHARLTFREPLAELRSAE